MYHIHTTSGFVISSKPYGEADRVLQIFTKELGLVVAVAQGIRLEKSKLRGHVPEYSLGVFSLVRGKDVWRIVGAENIHVFRDNVLLARIADLLRRLLHGEETNCDLYDHIHSLFDFLSKSSNQDQTLSADSIVSLESLVVFRVLHSLGYISLDDSSARLITSKDIDFEMLGYVSGIKNSLNKHINKALKESHL